MVPAPDLPVQIVEHQDHRMPAVPGGPDGSGLDLTVFHFNGHGLIDRRPVGERHRFHKDGFGGLAHLGGPVGIKIRRPLGLAPVSFQFFSIFRNDHSTASSRQKKSRIMSSKRWISSWA